MHFCLEDGMSMGGTFAVRTTNRYNRSYPAVSQAVGVPVLRIGAYAALVLWFNNKKKIYPCCPAVPFAWAGRSRLRRRR